MFYTHLFPCLPAAEQMVWVRVRRLESCNLPPHCFSLVPGLFDGACLCIIKIQHGLMEACWACLMQRAACLYEAWPTETCRYHMWIGWAHALVDSGIYCILPSCSHYAAEWPGPIREDEGIRVEVMWWFSLCSVLPEFYFIFIWSPTTITTTPPTHLTALISHSEASHWEKGGQAYEQCCSCISISLQPFHPLKKNQFCFHFQKDLSA